jgi:hypothetical protein
MRRLNGINLYYNLYHGRLLFHNNWLMSTGANGAVICCKAVRGLGYSTLHVSTQNYHLQVLYRTHNKKVNSFIIFIIIIIIIIRTRPDWPSDPPSPLYNGYRVFFPMVKPPGSGHDHAPPSSAEIKGRVELYFYSPSGLSWPVIGWPLPLPLPLLL